MTGRCVDLGVDAAALLAKPVTGDYATLTPTTGPSSLGGAS